MHILDHIKLRDLYAKLQCAPVLRYVAVALPKISLPLVVILSGVYYAREAYSRSKVLHETISIDLARNLSIEGGKLQ
jgi:hypothetical protein